MNGHQQDRSFVTAQPCNMTGCEQLRKLPANGVDGGDEADQQSRIRHRGDEERQDGAKGGEAKRGAKHTAIPKVDGDVVVQVIPDVLIQRGEHGWIVPERIFTRI